MSSGWILLGLSAALLALVVAQRVHYGRKGYSDETRQRLELAGQRLMWTPWKIGGLVAGPIAGVAIAEGAWLVAVPMLIAMVCLLAVHERCRRRTLREMGLELNRWGSVEVR